MSGNSENSQNFFVVQKFVAIVKGETMNNIVTSVPSFKGLYVVKCPTGKEAKEYEEMMNTFVKLDDAAHGNSLSDVFKPYAENYLKPNTGRLISSDFYRLMSEEYFEMRKQLSDANKDSGRLWSTDFLYLTPYHGEKQPEVQIIIATNGDDKILSKYRTYRELVKTPWMSLSDKQMLGYEDFDNPVYNRIIENGKKELEAETTKSMEEYEYATEGNHPLALSKFVHEMTEQARVALLQIQSFTDKTIPVYDYNEIMSLYEQGKFNPVTGMIENNETQNTNVVSKGFIIRVAEFFEDKIAKLRSGNLFSKQTLLEGQKTKLARLI